MKHIGKVAIATLTSGALALAVAPAAGAQGDTNGYVGEQPGVYQPEGSSGLGLLLPGLLILGSSYWFLNQDGSTYVSSEDRVHETPTEEEKKVSDKLLEDHADEVVKQAKEAPAEEAPVHAKKIVDTPAGKAVHEYADEQDHADEVAATTDRGIGANAGNNSVAVGVAALALAGLIGSAAFAARRFFA